jgi:hypothetical protein
LVLDDVNGLHFSAGDAMALRAAMARSMEEPRRLFAWGAASRKEAAEWTPEAGASRWIAAWRDLGLL